MRRPLMPLLLMPVLVSAVGCTGEPAPSAEADERAPPQAVDARARDTAAGDRADITSPLVAMDMPSTSADAGVPTGRWVLQKSEPPRAVWGARDSEGVLAFACDAQRQRLVLEREAVGVPDHVRLVSIEADGTRVDYPAERVDATLAPQLVTRIALDAPIVDRLLGARRMAVSAGADAIVADAPGIALRPVVDACRRLPAAQPRAATMVSSERGRANR